MDEYLPPVTRFTVDVSISTGVRQLRLHSVTRAAVNSNFLVVLGAVYRAFNSAGFNFGGSPTNYITLVQSLTNTSN